MTATVPSRVLRRQLAEARIPEARLALACCELCAHRCQVNRLANERGLCRVGADSRVFSAQVEVSDERALGPTFAIAFAGCDLRCSFCITGRESWNPQVGTSFAPAALAQQAARAVAQGAQSIMILGGEPTVHLPAVLELVSQLPEQVRLVWKTNAHGTEQSRRLLAGLFDLWLIDFKFGNDCCAERLSGASDYVATVVQNLVWAQEDSGVVVRHVLMPGHLECCWRPVAEWLAGHLPEVSVNLRSGFWAGWQASRHPELCRPFLPGDEAAARRLADELHLHLID
ncbi:MAG: radical SAM protein [Verrucomicrobiales bacterium]|nr:radical SAM protein [Verrucomicrobiales bacterium]